MTNDAITVPTAPAAEPLPITAPSAIDYADSVYYVQFDADGRVTAGGTMNRAFVYAAIFRGENWAEVPKDSAESLMTLVVSQNLQALFDLAETHWVNPGDRVRVLAERPPLERSLSPARVAPGSEATIADLPPCTVEFTGPVSGRQAHEQRGDFSIGFTVPGTYTLSLDAFPNRRATYELTVAEDRA